MDTVIGKLIDAGLKYLEGEVRRQTGMKEKLEKLRDIHYPKIQSVVAYASRQPQIRDEKLNKLLWQLRDAIDEADDVFDYLLYMKHEKQLAKNKKLRKVRSIMKNIRKIGKRALEIDPNFKRMEVAVEKVGNVSAELVDIFRHVVKNEKQEQQEKPRETGSMSVNDLIGRTEQKDLVLEWLRKPSNEHQTHIHGCRNISLLSIVGDGGMGKTSFLRHVYKDDKIKNEFELKMWVYVSNNFDPKKVIADMLEYINKERPHWETLATAQESLKSAVMSTKFLLVLDDIWEEEDESKWEDVLAPLAYGKLGSKILVTTRMDSAASMIAKVIKKKKETLILEGLEDAECLRLFNSHAFVNVENPDDHSKLRFIAGEIVKKLSGSPLAARVLGGVLSSSLDESHWMEILKSDFRYAESTQSGIMSTLRLSYISLPKHLQNCFKFCCIFPQDHEFDKDDLVRMWIALAFVQSSDNSKTLEDIGGEYFDVLVKKSFFHKIEDFKYYKMHDSLHKLAQSVSAFECLRVEGDKELPSKILETIRHLFVQTNNLEVLKKMEKFKNLRTLYISYNEDNQDFVEVLAEIFKASISIRVLYIEDQHLKIIPEAIGNLIHLRYLNLFRTEITLLPRSLSNLYHLQFIIYNSCLSSISHDFLPRDMNNLSNLHYLELPWDEFPGMYGIGKLNSLQKLDGFYVKNKIGYRIRELEFINDLRQLRIKFLENVKDAEEICSAKLCEKKNLTDLSLEWGDIMSRKFTHLDEKVLDKLQPCNNLKNLTISAYMGIKHAKWMKEIVSISNLKCIKLIGCLKLQTLPPFGQLPLLEELYLVDLGALEKWFEGAAADNRFFPCLTSLYLENCPNLNELPYLPPKLEILKIKNIGQTILNSCSISKSIPVRHFPNKTYIFISDETIRAPRYYGETPYCYNNIPYSYFAQPVCLGGHQEVETYENRQLISDKLSIKDPSVLLMEGLRSITSVQELTIESNSELVSFPNEVEQWFLKVGSSLCRLVFKDLYSLQSLPSSFESLSSLEILEVDRVPQLQVLPNLPASLKELRLQYLDSLECLPSCLPSLSSLQRLDINECPQLRELPDLPLSLKYLEVNRGLPYLPHSLQFRDDTNTCNIM